MLAWERYRLDVHRNPYFDRAEVALFLARRAGKPAGRIAAHVPRPDGMVRGTEGRFGFWAVAEDREVAVALVQAAGRLARRAGLHVHDRAVVVRAGRRARGPGRRLRRPPAPPGARGDRRGRSRLLEELAFEVAGESATWRLRTSEVGPDAPTGGERPGQAGPYADPRLVLERIAAVPDLSGALRDPRLRAAWGLARRARLADWEGCTVVRCSGRPEVEVPTLVAAAGRAGYSWVVAPWSPDPAVPPETVHRTYRLTW